MEREPETLEDALQMYVDAMVSHEDAQFEMAAVARYVDERMGGKALAALAQAAHRRQVVLKREAAVHRLAPLRERYPTLTFVHMNVLGRLDTPSEIVRWAEKTADEDWSPAQLRREIAAAHRKPQTPDVVLRKADSMVEKGKSVINQAVEAGVFEEAKARIESLMGYVKAKERQNGGK